MSEEIWKDVVGYEGIYQVSNLGNVFSLRRGKILSAGIMRFYYGVILQKNGERKTFLVHRIVAKAFLPNKNNLPQVNHINGIKTDNRLKNLEWTTCKENMKHAKETGLWHPEVITEKKLKSNRENVKKAYKSNMKKVRNIETGQIFNSAAEAARFYGKYRTSVSNSIRRKTRSAGYHWEYYEN